MIHHNHTIILFLVNTHVMFAHFELDLDDSQHLSEISYLMKEKDVFTDPEIKLCESKKKSPEKAEIIEMILYESVLPISSFIFLTEINNMSEHEIRDVCNDIVFESMKVIYVTKNIGNNCKNEVNEGDKDQNKSFLIEPNNERNEESEDKDIEIKDDQTKYNLQDSDVQGKVTSGEKKIENQMDEALDTKKSENEMDSTKIYDLIDPSTEKIKENPLTKIKDDELVISTKKELLELFNTFSNFSLKLDINNKKLKKSLEKRNMFFEKDKSQIAKTMYFEKLADIKKYTEKLSNNDLKKMIDIKNIHIKNDKYKRMIKALRRAIIETENLSKAIDREKREFIREFSEKMFIPENKEIFELKIAFNLGGSIFAPGVFLQVAQNIITTEKDSKIEKSVTSILNPIESLELYIRHKSNTEKKEEIIKFLLACMEKRNNIFFDEIDEAFKARSVLLDLYLRNIDSCGMNSKTNTCDLRNSRERMIDKYQESFIKNIIQKLKDVNEDMLENFVVINGDIVYAYKKLLITRSKNAKNQLLKIFQKRK